MDEETAFDRAVTAAGGITSLANKLGVLQSRVSNWRTRGVPPEMAPLIEKVIDAAVTRRELCPDFPWDPEIAEVAIG